MQAYTIVFFDAQGDEVHGDSVQALNGTYAARLAAAMRQWPTTHHIAWRDVPLAIRAQFNGELPVIFGEIDGEALYGVVTELHD